MNHQIFAVFFYLVKIMCFGQQMISLSKVLCVWEPTLTQLIVNSQNKSGWYLVTLIHVWW